MPVPALSASCLLAMMLASTPVAAQPSSSPGGAPEVRRIELEQDAPGQVHDLRIGPGVPTVLLFDARLSLEEAEVERRERFQRVALTRDTLTLLSSWGVLPGETFSLTVRYTDGAKPASARFRLVVVPPAEAELQVDVFRHPLSAEFFQRQEQEARAEVRQCKAALARARAEGGGLAGLILAGQVDEQGVSGRLIFDLLTMGSRGTFELVRAIGYRAARVSGEGAAPRVRVLLLLRLRLQEADARPWRAASAELVGPSGARWPGAVLQREPIHPGWMPGHLVVEAELPEEALEGVFSLTLEESGGSRHVSLGGVRFP